MTGSGPRMTYLHVEEPSMEETLKIVVPRIIGNRDVPYKIIEHGSKQKLLRDLPKRLAGYARRIPREDLRILVLIDRDSDDCRRLKARLENIAKENQLPTKSSPAPDGRFRVVNRIVVEELEAWFFGDVPALCRAYDSIPASLADRREFRNPDAIAGGTWEKLRHVLQRAGYFTGTPSLPKCEVARRIAQYMEPQRNSSQSFRQFVNGLETLFN